MALDIYFGIAGIAVGIAGGLVGTLASLRGVQSNVERRFILKCAAGLTVLIVLFLIGLMLLPSPQRLWLWTAYVVALPLAIIAGNRTHARLRREHHGDAT